MRPEDLKEGRNLSGLQLLAQIFPIHGFTIMGCRCAKASKLEIENTSSSLFTRLNTPSDDKHYAN